VGVDAAEVVDVAAVVVRGGFDNDRPRGGFRGGFGRRDFDRHSASDRTGVKATEKREGGGAHNWGTFKDDVEGEQEQQQDTSADWTERPDAPAEAVESGEAADGDVEKAEPEPQELTLDEWKAMKAAENKPKPEFNIRRAGEGVDNSQWKGGREYIKKHDEEEEEEEDESKGVCPSLR